MCDNIYHDEDAYDSNSRDDKGNGMMMANCFRTQLVLHQVNTSSKLEWSLKQSTLSIQVIYVWWRLSRLCASITLCLELILLQRILFAMQTLEVSSPVAGAKEMESSYHLLEVRR